MKRLIKGTLFKMLNIKNNEYISDGYYECFINPDNREFDIIMELNKYKEFRGLVDNNGDLYIFSNNILHEDAVKKFGIPYGLPIQGTKDILMLENLSEDENIIEIKRFIEKCNSLLSFYNKNTKLELDLSTEDDDPPLVFTLNDLLNYLDNEDNNDNEENSDNEESEDENEEYHE